MLSDPGGRPDLSVEHSLMIWFELTDGMTFSDGKTYGEVYVDSVPPIYFMNTKSISSSSRTLIGKCLCGAVQVSIADEFLYAGYCHCPDCRASSGSAFSAFAGIPKEKLQLTCGAGEHLQISQKRRQCDPLLPTLRLVAVFYRAQWRIRSRPPGHPHR